MNTYAIVQGGVVVNLGVADAPLDSTWILATDPAIAIGWAYDTEWGFRPPLQDGGAYPPDSSKTFTPFQLSASSGAFTVSLSNNILQIGCRSYNCPLLLQAFTDILASTVQAEGVYSAVSGGIQQGGFIVLTADCQAIVNAINSAS